MIKTAIANLTKIHYYDPKMATRVNCDVSHSGLGATLEQQTAEGDWVPIAFASRFLNIQEKKYSTNELKLLEVVWSVDRSKHYLLGKEFVIATDHKALVSVLDENRSNKTYQSRLTRWVDRLLPYQFKVVHIPGRNIGIVDYVSRDPKGEPWPESEFDEKFVVTSIESFHKALDCLHSQLSDHDGRDRNENVLEYSVNDHSVSKRNTSSNSCYGNQNAQKRTGHDRNESETSSRSIKRENCEKPEISLSQSFHPIQLVEKSNIIQRNLPIHTKTRIRDCFTENRAMKTIETLNSGKGRKIVRIQEQKSLDTMTEEVTETTF